MYKSVTENERTLDGRMNQLHQQISNLESQKKECENLSDEMKEKIDNLTGQIVLIRNIQINHSFIVTRSIFLYFCL
jgi:peptidoglycan hydrolase CwlO-like protein